MLQRVENADNNFIGPVPSTSVGPRVPQKHFHCAGEELFAATAHAARSRGWDEKLALVTVLRRRPSRAAGTEEEHRWGDQCDHENQRDHHEGHVLEFVPHLNNPEVGGTDPPSHRSIIYAGFHSEACLSIAITACFISSIASFLIASAMKLSQVLVLQLLALVVTLSDSFLQRRVVYNDPSPETTVSTNYDTFREVINGLHRVDTADTNVFSSMLISPGHAGKSAATLRSADQRLELRAPTRDNPSTHLAYDCTSTSALWKLEQDPNVLSVEEFKASSDHPGGLGDPDVIATATISVADCLNSVRSSVGNVVAASSFLGVSITTLPAYFYVLKAVGLNVRNNNASSLTPFAMPSCRVRLELARATFTQVYPNCRIKFHSTDVANLIQTESNEAARTAQARRDLGASSFGFVKASSCKYDCGEDGEVGDIDVDKCWAEDGSSRTEVQCKLQFYAQNNSCTSECGHKGESETLPANQCYDCISSDSSCKSGYNSTDDGCCRVLQCEVVEGTTFERQSSLSWNLQDDGLTVSNSSYPIFETGNCSDTSDPSTSCCRITCENCFLNVSIASLFADIEIVGASYEEAVEMELTGNANLEVALYAPNGCTLDETTQLKNASFTIPLGETGLSIEIIMNLNLQRKLSLQPHGSTAIVGATAELVTLTAGSRKSQAFHNVDITSNISSKLAQSSIDVEMELKLIPSFQASLSLLKSVAQVGVQADFFLFVELNSSFSYPEPFPGLLSEYLDDTSMWHGGNCELPHYMEYNCNAGYGGINISIPLAIKIPVVGNKTAELDIVSSSERKRYSLFSGCVTTAYDADILLSTALDVALSLSNDKMDALRMIFGWALGMTDIDPDFVNITDVSHNTGEIFITLSVPPSLGELYPNASAFIKEVYQRARNKTFTSSVSDYVGFEIGAQCNDNWWGAKCDQTCDAQNCTAGNISCNAVDGTTLSCGSCKTGYWGATCESACQVPDECTAARCDQTTGGMQECVSCGEDQGESMCGDTRSGADIVRQVASAAILAFPQNYTTEENANKTGMNPVGPRFIVGVQDLGAEPLSKVPTRSNLTSRLSLSLATQILILVLQQPALRFCRGITIIIPVVLVHLLGLSCIRANQGATGSTNQAQSPIGSKSGSTSAPLNDITVGDGATTVYLPAAAVQNEFLNFTGVNPDSILAVASNYSTLVENSPGLYDVTTPSTNVLASVLIIPAFANESADTIKSNQLESSPVNSSSSRMQLMYNCTTASNLWNLLEDPNVLQLEHFQQFPSNNTNASNDQREIVVIASVQIASCSTIESTFVDRPVVGNSFFGAAFNTSPVFFYVVNSTTSKIASSTSRGVLELEMARANLTEVYPTCKIKFHLTDLDNIVRTESTTYPIPIGVLTMRVLSLL
ncbi:unnamed protein product [Phytophthora lilii]|uniref:Unnamed protein product n=1 Tax=Phytophthora lilii TaxID=2077276 RepID=A0A9W6WZ30_9STRA|nr:unnamed protein product [Phytophthora lilii]